MEHQELEHLELEIRKRAYELWERDGQPHGKNLRYWLEAERAVAGERAQRETDGSKDLEEGLEETFPASDTPSSLRRGRKSD